METAIVLMLGVGFMAHLALGLLYLIFQHGPNKWIGLWLCLAWSIALLRGIELRRVDVALLSDTGALLVWGNIMVAVIAASVSCLARAAASDFSRRQRW